MASTPAVPGATNLTSLVGNEIVEVAGNAPTVQQATVDQIAAGGAARHGTVTLNGVTPITVANAKLTVNSVIVFTLKTVGGTVGAYPAVQTVSPGVGFTVLGTALDTSIYNYYIIG